MHLTFILEPYFVIKKEKRKKRTPNENWIANQNFQSAWSDTHFSLRKLPHVSQMGPQIWKQSATDMFK